jgi:uncharacterized protein DUF6249
MNLMAMAIPLVAIVLGMGIAFWAIYMDHQKKRLLFDERRLLIEKGMTPPPLPPLDRACRSPQDCLRRGIILAFLALGLGAGFYILRASEIDGPPHWGLGIAATIVGSIGLGNLVYYLVSRDRRPDQPIG